MGSRVMFASMREVDLRGSFSNMVYIVALRFVVFHCKFFGVIF